MDISQFPLVPVGFARVFYYTWNPATQTAELRYDLYPHHEGMTIRELRYAAAGY